MKLGESAQITIGTTRDLEGITLFYERLGFTKVAAEGNWVQFTDGANRILVAEAEEAYRSLTYFAREMGERIALMEKMGVPIANRRIQDGTIRATVYSPNGVAVTLIEQDPAALLQLPRAQRFRGGKFGEYSIPVADREVAIAFWNQWDFETLYLSATPYPWAILSDGLLVLGLHQTDHFSQEAMTYFAPDMADRIAALKADGFKFRNEETDESGRVNNAVLEDLDGFRFFFFTGDI